MTFPAPDKVPYDPWFDDNIPKAQYGSMQCWIATEDTAQWSTVFDASVHSKMYEIATLTGVLLGGSDEII